MLHSCPSAAHLALHVDVVEQYELVPPACGWFGVTVLPEQAQVRLAVPLRVLRAGGHVAEHLVVGAVLLDDVDDVLDRRLASPTFSGIGLPFSAPASVPRTAFSLSERRAGVGRLGVASPWPPSSGTGRKLTVPRNSPPMYSVHPAAQARSGFVPAGVRLAQVQALAVRHVSSVLSSLLIPHARGVPAGRDEAERLHLLAGRSR